MSSQLRPPPDGNQNRTGPLVGMVVGSVTFAGILVILRMYTRLFLNKSARWDDWTIVLAFIATTIGLTLDCVGIHYGDGRHQYYLSDHQVQEFKKFGYGDWIQTFFTLMATKVSICLLLLRISPSKRIVRPIQSLIIFLIVTNVILTLLWILQCIPVDGAWDATKKKTAKCFTQGQLQRIVMAQAIIAIISDFILAGFPIIILRNVQIKSKQKVLLCGLMGLGLITAACCIVRTVMNFQNIHADQTWVSIDNYMWRTAEVNIGISAACIPTLLPLYRLLRDKINTARKNSNSDPSHFTKLIFGQSSKTSNSSQKVLWAAPLKNDTRTQFPQKIYWESSVSHPFSRIEKARGEDVEMQMGIIADRANETSRYSME